MKNYNLIIYLSIGLNLFLALSLLNKKQAVEPTIINNYFTNKKEDIINDYNYKKDSTQKHVDSISFDSSYLYLQKWLFARTDGTRYDL